VSSCAYIIPVPSINTDIPKLPCKAAAPVTERSPLSVTVESQFDKSPLSKSSSNKSPASEGDTEEDGLREADGLTLGLTELLGL
jgi:hypothetical protein